MAAIRILATTLCLLASGAAFAQSSVTLYGNIDLYGNYMHSSSGATSANSIAATPRRSAAARAINARNFTSLPCAPAC